MDDRPTLDTDLQENLRSFQTDSLFMLIRICLVIAASWFVLLLAQIGRQMSDIGLLVLPWALFTLPIVAAWGAYRRQRLKLARNCFFAAILVSPNVDFMLNSQNIAFLVYALIIAVLISGVLISPVAPFRMAGFGFGTFLLIGLLHAFNLLNPPVFTTFLQFLEAFAFPTLILLLVAIGSWLATRDLVASISWAMDENRLAARRAQRLGVSENRAARTLLELEGSYHVQSQLNNQLQELNRQLQIARAAADEANTLKTRFLANMSHELRTPLNAIINFTQFLGKSRYGEITPRQIELQERVLANSEHLLGLINDILDLSKIEAGRMELHLEPLDLAPIFHGVMATAVGLTKSKGLLLETDIEEEIPPVRGDKVRVRQILLNLVSNAAKFTDAGSITLRAFERDGIVQISVCDTGSGIPANELPLVFEEFHQVEQAASSRRQQGTGLGLPISRQLVILQGGDMWAESELDTGSTFSFSLPIAHNVAPDVVVYDPAERAVA